jgi:hypothetical protein
MFMAGWIIEMHTRYRVNIKPKCIIKTRPFHYYVIYTYSLRPLTPGYGLQFTQYLSPAMGRIRAIEVQTPRAW